MERISRSISGYVWRGTRRARLLLRWASGASLWWDGDYYALAVTTRLDAEGAEGKGGMVCIGPVHYNTVEEIRRLGQALREMTP